MKFSPFLTPGSRQLLDFRIGVRASGCPHCGCGGGLITHGYLSGHAAEGHGPVTRAQRFYCSNRHSKSGCGRTFSVHWLDVIPYCTLRASQLFKLLNLRIAMPSAHAAWHQSHLPISLRTAYRWLSRWTRLSSHVRALLVIVAPPPGKADGMADPLTLRHLAGAFPQAACPIGAFQQGLQMPITGPCG